MIIQDLPVREGKLPPIVEGKCPVEHEKVAVKESSCPMASHEVDSLVSENQMPPPNQRPHPDQKKALPTNRIRSSIPRGSEPEPEKEKWDYPSEQMFYNALKKKVRHTHIHYYCLFYSHLTKTLFSKRDGKVLMKMMFLLL